MGMRRLLVAVGLLALAACPGRLDDPERFTCHAETDVLIKKCGIDTCHDPVTKQNGLDLASPGIAMRITTGTSTCMSIPLIQLLPNKLTATPACGATMPVG